MDVHSKATRSYNMSQIKGKNTKPEIAVRKFLFSKGLRYRLHLKTLPGKPDLVFPKFKTVLFVHGCFWHGHAGCKNFVVPKTRTEWWLHKINSNSQRDKKNIILLRKLGWKVLVIFECSLSAKKQEEALNKLFKNLVRS